ncbi:methyl-accepting chemotaxis protein [Photobacterium aquimaris]|uniref:PAS domain S-box protein n=2 Tax=Photobacterium aquimaris TaxID=512643 RepID=A0A2T3I280_9GAMM|nr:methyl-accepting chemotaxis protein [Photobacterium aquimaris]OBU26403.1 aerotaxis receptor Aer [Photobacterium aquimaris]PSU12211.1 PAS domain S-box protein [Photobacterium aquimaris]
MLPSNLEQEIQLNLSNQIVSTTDIDGNITYINDYFCDTSGYSREELIGKNHNILRHQDMPDCIFEDLWKSIKKQHYWRGAVKNKCKDGRFYWVDAFVTPLFENNKVIGYQSVRLYLEPKARKKAESLYKKLHKNSKIKNNVSPSIKWSLYSLLTAIILMLCISISSFFSLLLPMLTVALFYRELIIYPLWLRHNEQQYKSFSQGIFNENTANIAEYIISMKDAQIRAILARTQEASIEVDDEITKINTLSVNCTNKIKQQNSHLDSISTAIEEMSSSINGVAENCHQTLVSTSVAESSCHDTEDLVSITTEHIMQLTTDINRTSELTTKLATETELITSILQEIQSISDQTNLLALNAAIEAARAGEHGRGFSVVAEEVRALSVRTHNATSQIQQSVNYIIQSLNKIALQMEQGITNANICVTDINNMTSKLQDIFKLITEISNVSIQISTATDQQATVSKEINQNSHQIYDSSTNNLKEMESINLSMSHMKDSSIKLITLSKTFQ